MHAGRLSVSVIIWTNRGAAATAAAAAKAKEFMFTLLCVCFTALYQRLRRQKEQFTFTVHCSPSVDWLPQRLAKVCGSQTGPMVAVYCTWSEAKNKGERQRDTLTCAVFFLFILSLWALKVPVSLSLSRFLLRWPLCVLCLIPMFNRSTHATRSRNNVHGDTQQPHKADQSWKWHTRHPLCSTGAFSLLFSLSPLPVSVFFFFFSSSDSSLEEARKKKKKASSRTCSFFSASEMRVINFSSTKVHWQILSFYPCFSFSFHPLAPHLFNAR